MERKSIEAIFWDFDGVLIDSMPIRNMGFELVLRDYPEDQVAELLKYHKQNGGLSRYAKFRYFFNEIRNEPISEQGIMELAFAFSKIMMNNLCDENLLINETISYIKKNAGKIPMYIVSGSDQNELRDLCNFFQLTSYFNGIYGSPTTKAELVQNILKEKNYSSGNCLLIGDSMNDYDAAKKNGLHFMAYNNEALKGFTDYEISFK